MLEEFNISLSAAIEKLNAWVEGFIAFLPNFILAILVMALSIFLSRYVKKYFSRAVDRLSSNKTITSLLSNIATAGFLLLMLFIVLGILELDTALTSMLAGAGVVGLAIGLAVQEPLMNVFSGILLSTKSLFNVGDLVKTNGFFGIIHHISLRSTILRDMDGQDVLIPNKMVLQNPLVNYTSTGERRVVLSCGISYGDDLEKVKQVAMEAIRNHEEIEMAPDKPFEFYYTEFGSSSINFILRFWMKKWKQSDYLREQSAAIMALKKAFDENDITIPFPIRTLDFGIKGGEKLNEVMATDELKSSGSNKN